MVDAAIEQPIPKPGSGKCIQDELIEVIQRNRILLSEPLDVGLEDLRILALEMCVVIRSKLDPNSTIEDLIQDIEKRKLVGLERYGTLLYPHNGRDGLLDAYQEFLDGPIYLTQVILENDSVG